jgi:hypothetical protein
MLDTNVSSTLVYTFRSVLFVDLNAVESGELTRFYTEKVKVGRAEMLIERWR